MHGGVLGDQAIEMAAVSVHCFAGFLRQGR
jgi:hypothetical protein